MLDRVSSLDQAKNDNNYCNDKQYMDQTPGGEYKETQQPSNYQYHSNEV